MHSGEITLGGCALRGRGLVLTLGLRRAPLGLDALLGGSLAPLPRVAQPFGRESDVALEPPHFELDVTEPALDFGAPRFGRVPGLDPRFALVLGILESRAGRGKLLGQLARSDAERAE